MLKEWLNSFVKTIGKLAGYLVFGVMSIFGIIFFLNRNDKYRNKKKKLIVDVDNPNKDSDRAKGEQLEKDIDDLLGE